MTSVGSSGNRFYVSFVDAYSMFTWLYCLVHTSDATRALISFHRFVERQLGHCLKVVKKDNG